MNWAELRPLQCLGTASRLSKDFDNFKSMRLNPCMIVWFRDCEQGRMLVLLSEEAKAWSCRPKSPT